MDYCVAILKYICKNNNEVLDVLMMSIVNIQTRIDPVSSYMQKHTKKEVRENVISGWNLFFNFLLFFMFSKGCTTFIIRKKLF